MDIDITFDFTTDSPGYWDGFWNRNNGLGAGGSDPDTSSPTLRNYHKQLWSKPLPNGQFFELSEGSGYNYLYWNGFRFGSDSIIVSLRYKRNQNIINELKNNLADYRAYYEDYIRKTYRIGGAIIFPKHQNSINQRRGTSLQIADRWDLTMECIRRYYNGENSPLYEYLEKDRAFFDLFVDFKGYVEFFLLQDCVSDDFGTVYFWEGNGELTECGLPKNYRDYMVIIEKEMEFLNKRNQRILDYCKKH